MTGERDEAARATSPGGRSPALPLAVAVLVVGGLSVVLRAAPVLDASVEELWGRLYAVYQESLEARARPDEWRRFAAEASAGLKEIAEDARKSQQRRQGAWRWIAGVDRREEAALKEVQRLAESELPGLIAAGPKSHALREKAVVGTLKRLDDHLAGASPYLPPMRPIENQEGMDRTTGVKRGWPEWLVAFIVVDVMVVAFGAVWWVWRTRRRAV